jgi:ribosomal protein S25
MGTDRKNKTGRCQEYLVNAEEEERFRNIAFNVIGRDVTREGIGTLSEKTVHAVLKEFFKPDGGECEVKVEKHVADIKYGKEIIEIQSRSFGKLSGKLSVFLKKYHVTIVYPVAHKKTMRYVDPKTGEVQPPRRSSHTGNPYAIFKELVHIIPFLNEKNLSYKIALIDMEEYRLLDGYSKNRKKGATKSDKLPQSLYDIVEIKKAGDFKKFIPDGLEKEFTVKEFAKAAKITGGLAQTVMQILYRTGCVDYAGKRGREYLYSVCHKKSRFSKP